MGDIAEEADDRDDEEDEEDEEEGEDEDAPVLAYTKTQSQGVPLSSRVPLVIHIFRPVMT